MDARRLIPSDYISSADFGKRDVTFTITSVDRIAFTDDAKKTTQKKGLITFAETDKKWVVNKTNAECIRLMFGNETNDWNGKRVTLFAAPHRDTLTKEDTTAIRVRGSPDLPASKSVTFRLGRKGAVTMTMEKTAAGSGLSADAIDRIIDETAAADLDRAWNENKLGDALKRLPKEDADRLVARFKAKRGGKL